MIGHIATSRWQWLGAVALLLALPVVAQPMLEQRISQDKIPQDQVAALLGKMSRVAHTLNYQGHFTYEHGSSLESFKVRHWVEEGVEHEHLSYLSGPEREIVRKGKLVDCVSPGNQLLMGRIALSNTDRVRLDEYYELDIRGEERIAGRIALVLQVVPRDNYRYGYLLSIDRETGLLLKSLLIDEHRRVLERFQFVDLQLNPDQGGFTAQPAARLRRNANPHLSECNQSQPGSPKVWELAWLPPGFIFSGQQQVRETTDMLMYTDGLSTFSVFIEPANGQLMVEGRAQRGATNAYMGRITDGEQEYRMTVVGEIPAGAAEQVATGLGVRARE